MRVPVVSTDLTGVPEIVDDGVNGFLVSQRDSVALANALAHLLSNNDLREQMGRAGRQTVMDKFDLNKNVAVLRQWLTGKISDSARERENVQPEQAYSSTLVA